MSFSLSLSLWQEAILDVNPDEAVDMAKKQRLLHWDSRKKKFVKTTLAELSEGGKGGSRKIRTESGKLHIEQLSRNFFPSRVSRNAI